MNRLLLVPRRAILTLVCTAALAVPAFPSDGDGCSTEDFQGRYAVQALIFNTSVAPPRPETAGGSLYADGEGRITEWTDILTIGSSDGTGTRNVPRDLVAEATAANSELRYEVNADCRMQLGGDLMTPFGVVPLSLNGALVDGGRSVLLTQVSDVRVSVAEFRATGGDEDDEEIVDRISGLEAQIGDLKDLLDRVAIRNGLVP